ncbi:MAG: NUDIX domain-containing protein [Acidobacteriota bacterium]
MTVPVALTGNVPSLDPGYRFCPKCGGRLARKALTLKDPPRLVCSECRFIFFIDPKIAAGAIFSLKGQIILGRRAIEPGHGKWVFPGGFVDRGETVEEAARRETMEEMNVEVRISRLLNVYSYSGQPTVVIVFSAKVVGGELRASDEILEVRGFAPGQIPWKELAFTSTRDALRDYIRRHHGSAARRWNHT